MAPTVVPKYAVLPSDISSNLKDKIEFESNNKNSKETQSKDSLSGEFFRKGVLRIFAKSKGRQLCQCRFFNKVAN